MGAVSWVDAMSQAINLRNGSTSTTSHTRKKPNVAPIAKVAILSYTTVTDPVTVTTAGTTDADGSLSSGSLNWGDGTTVTFTGAPAATYAHTYASAGTKTITLVVVDNKFAQNSSSCSVTLPLPVDGTPPPDPGTQPVPPTAVLTYVSGQYRGVLYVLGTDGTVQGSTPLASGSISWGDGTAAVTWTGAPASTLSHTFANAGTYTARMTVVDTGGLSSTASRILSIASPIVVNQTPTAKITNTSQTLGTLVVSTAGTFDPENALASGFITWGDNQTTSWTGNPAASYTHVYATSATYTVTLSVTDAGALTATNAFSAVIALTSDPTIGAGVLTVGPQVTITCPLGAVAIATSDSIQSKVDANPAGTTFCLAAGTHLFGTATPNTTSITPKTGNTFVGEFGAILDGTAWVTADATAAAFRSHLNGTINTVTIRNLEIQHMPQRAIHAWHSNSTGWVIEYNNIHDCFCGISFPVASTIAHNYVHACTGDSNGGLIPNGAYISTGGANSVVEYNEFSYCGDTQKVIDFADNIIFRHNYIHHNAGPGIWYDGSCSGGLIEYNTIEYNTSEGVFYEISRTGIVRNNLIRHNGDVAVFISTSQNCEIYNNTLEENWRGIAFFANLDIVGGSDPSGFAWDLASNYAHNNSIQITAGQTAAFPLSNYMTFIGTLVVSTPYTNGTKNLVFDYNHYHHSTTDNLFYWGASTMAWAAWHASITVPQDLHGDIS